MNTANETLEQLQVAAHDVGRMTTKIVPSRGWQGINVCELWRSRELLGFLVWRDVKVRYKQTVLGAAWAVLQPAMMMLVFTVFLGVMAKVPSANDPVFVYAGMLPWTFFATALANAGSSVITSERLITKTYFPRLIVPLAAVGAAVVDFIIASTLMAGMMMWRGITPGVELLMVPVIFVLIALAAAGVGILLAGLTVAYRDFRYIIPFLIQFWLFATPTAYSRPPADASPWIQMLIVANPMSGLIGSFRAAMFNEPIPWNLLAPASVSVVLVFLAGSFYFRRVEDTLADIV
jgi:lipopolysaccharide transport system permease protein